MYISLASLFDHCTQGGTRDISDIRDRSVTGGCGDMVCVVVRGTVSWGSNSEKAQAQYKLVGEGKEIAH